MTSSADAEVISHSRRTVKAHESLQSKNFVTEFASIAAGKKPLDDDLVYQEPNDHLCHLDRLLHFTIYKLFSFLELKISRAFTSTLCRLGLPFSYRRELRCYC